MEILIEKTLEMDNLVSKSGKYKATEFQLELLDMVKEYKDYAVGECVITTTKMVEIVNREQILDVEMLMPVSYRIPVEMPYIFKNKLKILNALYMKVTDINRIEDALNIVNQYIVDNKLLPITSAYLVQTKVENQPLIEVYIGISQNVL